MRPCGRSVQLNRKPIFFLENLTLFKKPLKEINLLKKRLKEMPGRNF